MIDWLLEPLNHPFNQRAILAALIIGCTNGYASAFVVLRKSALKVGSLSHALLPGIAVAILVAGLNDWSAFLGALFAALLIGLGSLAVSRGSRLDQDSALAILYTAAFSGGIILLRRIGVTQEMEEWLFGNIMGLRDGDLWMNFWISCGALGLLTALHRPLLMTLFDAEVAATLGVPVRALNYLLMAVLIVVLISSLQAVGCMLAVGLLVAPAATIYLLTDSTNALFWGGALLGGLAASFAVLAGWWLNIEQGPAIVLVLGAIFGISFLFSPKYGLLGRAR
ncbi:MAG: metal ABC transporter permease [Verrucomicrobiaceae bacterium]|nr:MAG: metal ABC transporter permease [Verrucomicrobiaceae bacterium]RPJ32868.1 MAG: metal ABC transporter permease [Verrucomicrobiaceae bacterium]